MFWVGTMVAASCLGAISVAMGAFGSHGLKKRITGKQLETYEIGVRYFMYHSLALLGVAFVGSRGGNFFIHGASILLVLGSVLFSGSLWVLIFRKYPLVGLLTPIGGGLLILGWIFMGLGVLYL